MQAFVGTNNLQDIGGEAIFVTIYHFHLGLDRDNILGRLE